MKTFFTSILCSLLLLPSLVGQNEVSFDASESWTAFMNVFNLDGSYAFGSGWEVALAKSTLDTENNTITLQPNFNTYADNPNDEFWVNATTMEGNKTMEANTFVEPGETFNGTDLTFSGFVQSNTLSDDYTATLFIKALDPDNGFADALGGTKILLLPESGEFSVSATGAELAAGLLIQYGFAVTGRNANPANEADLGSVVIGDQASSVNDLAALDVTYFPNPVQDVINLRAQDELEAISILNLSGQEVLSRNLNSTHEAVDIANLPAGMYVMRVIVDGQEGVAKLIKQ
ncbi:MAG: T9SS type A sorting domain-containing protein [Bacteroidota bacterium]